MEERATLEHPDKEIKETAPWSSAELLPQKFTWQRQLAKLSIGNYRNKQKESPKMVGQRKNSQSKVIEEYPEKELNEIEASSLSDIEF